MKNSTSFPIILQKDINPNPKYIILKGKNKIKVEKGPRLSIASHYIGKRANKFGVFTNQFSLNKVRQSNIDPNFFAKFTNKKLNALIHFTPEDLDRFKEIPIKDARKTSIDKFLHTIWYNGIPTPMNVLNKHRSKFLNYIKERKTLSVRFHKSNSNKNYYNTFNSLLNSDSELTIIGDNKSLEDINISYNRINLLTPCKKIKQSTVKLRKMMFAKNKNLSQSNLMSSEIMNDISLFPKQQNQRSEKKTIIKRIKLCNDIKISNEELRYFNR